MRRRKCDAEQTRSNLLDAAERVFHRRGVSHTSLCEIAGEAGVTRGAFYWHFNNKADLIHALHQRMNQRINQGLSPILHRKIDALQTLRALMMYMLYDSLCDPQQRVTLEILLLKSEYHGEVKQVFESVVVARDAWREMMHTLFLEAQAQGSLRCDVTADAMLETLRYLLYGSLSLWLMEPQFKADRARVETLVNIFFEGMTPVRIKLSSTV